MSLEQFNEEIDTECSLIGSPTIPIDAIRIDGAGGASLKFLLCKNSLKSCDYLKFTENKIIFIEFSDFYEQINNLTETNSIITNLEISEDNMQALLKRKLIIQPKDVIKEEIQSKISETLLLFELIKNNYDIKEHLNKKLIFLVCLCKVIDSHSVLFDNILRSLQKKFKHNIEIDMFIFTELETYIID
jgi:hypothetical protein